MCVYVCAQTLRLLKMWWIWMQWFPAYWRHLNNSKTLWRQIAIQTEKKKRNNNKTKQNWTIHKRHNKDSAKAERLQVVKNKIKAYTKRMNEYSIIAVQQQQQQRRQWRHQQPAAAAPMHEIKTIHNKNNNNNNTKAALTRSYQCLTIKWKKKLQRTIKDLRASI